MNLLRAAQTANADSSRGLLQVNVVSIQNNFPISGASVTIASKANPEQIIERISTNSSGQTQQVSLPAPPLEYSFDPGGPVPYSEYVVSVEAEGFQPFTVTGTEILPDSTAIQPIRPDPGKSAGGIRHCKHSGSYAGRRLSPEKSLKRRSSQSMRAERSC